MSSKSRTISPLRFRKRHSFSGHSTNGKLAASIPSFASSTLSRTSAVSHCQSLSGKGRASGPIFMSEKMCMSSNSFNTRILERTNSPTSRSKENVTVTVRFRPLCSMEIEKGDEMAWYADGETTVRTKLNAATVYAFDRIFGPTTTTTHVYGAAAQHVVRGAMDGINGTVFAYGVTSSGKTYTMHGDETSPGIIPLAIESVFSIIQETPNREFLLRVSYLEIYNEVINDLLNPTGQNLRIREDAQGPYVEGVKEEVVLSPAHCLSLIATGEEHRHVGSNNVNLLSSRSHTIFTLTIESSPRDSDNQVTLSQLNLIDLAGSESSKTETTGLRQKEGSYINKSLLTLGTVISKLIDGKATHVPYRDSKLTRLLQPSLSGRGHVSLICTVTPASSTSEETHNTLKFAHRAKQVEIRCCPNKIIDEKSLIKKYQKEIRCLKNELEQLKRSMIDKFCMMANHEDFATLKQQLEAGQLRLQSRLEEEEQAKASLLGRIQRLTKLILVSTKNTAAQTHMERQIHRRSHSFGLEELAYLPNGRRESSLDEEGWHISDLSVDGGNDSIHGEDSCNGENKSKRGSLWPWFKLKKNEPGTPMAHLDSDNSSNASSITSGSQVDSNFDPGAQRKSSNAMADGAFHSESLGCSQAGEFYRDTVQGGGPPPLHTERKILGSQDAGAELQATSFVGVVDKSSIRINGSMLSNSDAESKVGVSNEVTELRLQVLNQATRIEKLELERDLFRQQNDMLQIQCSQFAEEVSYAKELASAAAMELKNLAQEVTNLSLQNTKLAAELACAEQLTYSRTGSNSAVAVYEEHGANSWKSEDMMMDKLKTELLESIEREACREVLLAEKEFNEIDIRQMVDALKKREVWFEKEFGERYMSVLKLKNEPINKGDSVAAINAQDLSCPPDRSMQTRCAGDRHVNKMKKIPSMDFKALDDCLGEDGHHSPELQSLVLQLENEDLEGLDLVALEDLSTLHAEALARLSHAKARVKEKLEMSSSRCFQTMTKQCEEWVASLCRICSAVHASAAVLPCNHHPCKPR